MKRDKQIGWVVFSLVLLLLVIRFLPQMNFPLSSSPSQPAASSDLAPTASILIPTSTPLPVQQQQNPQPAGAAEPTQPPLRFTFPTPGPVPIVAWRAALYPIPWAQSPHDHFYFARPIAADEINWPLADYRYGGIYFGPDIIHSGVDIDAPKDTPVLAAADGQVVWAGVGLLYGEGYSKDPYGNAVVIRHDFGYNGERLFTAYAHMDKILTSVGQRVRQGDVLGLVGSTGNTTGPHLHFEVRVDSNYFFNTRNPELWLSPPQGMGVLVARIMDKAGNLLAHWQVQVASLSSDQSWDMRTYGNDTVNGDDYYQENMVLSDLPEGNYIAWTTMDKIVYRYKFHINAGSVTYINFRGEDGFDSDSPPGSASTPSASVNP
jgi:murein DD-endopeptidase MepM/ murein hydrolase activator NlpD